MLWYSHSSQDKSLENSIENSELTKSPLWNINISTSTIHYSHCKNLKHFNWKYSIWWFWPERYFYLYLIRPRWCPYVNIGWKCFIFFWQKQKQERRRLFSQIQSIVRKSNKADIYVVNLISLEIFYHWKKQITVPRSLDEWHVGRSDW